MVDDKKKRAKGVGRNMQEIGSTRAFVVNREQALCERVSFMRRALFALAFGVTFSAAAQVPDWTVAIPPPSGSAAFSPCAGSSISQNGVTSPRLIVRNPQGDIFVVSCPAGTNLSVGSTSVSTARLNGTTGGLIWKRDFSGTELSFPTGGQNLIAIDLNGNIVIASTFFSDESTEFTHVLKYDGTSGQTIWQALVLNPAFGLDVLSSGNLRLNLGNETRTLLGSTGAVISADLSQALPDGGSASITESGLSFRAHASEDGLTRRVSRYSGVFLPAAPTITSSSVANAIISISFLPPSSDGGSPILDYLLQCVSQYDLPVGRVVQSSPAILVLDYDSAPAFVLGNTLTCSMRARSAFGNGPPSVAVIFYPEFGSFALTKVLSRKTHGAFGVFELAIARNIVPSGPVTVEPRVVGLGHEIVFQFNNQISSTSTITATIGAAMPVAINNFAIVGNELRVPLPAGMVPNTSRVTVSAQIVAPGFSNSVSATIGFLLGDVDSTRAVDTADVSAIKSRSGQRVSPDNFRFDINTTGTINASDILATRARNGSVLGN